MSILSVAAGNNARIHGVCCLAIGDGTIARGAYQVVRGDKLTLPDQLLPNESTLKTWAELKELKLTFQAMQDQKIAPEGFANRAVDALDFLMDSIEKKIGFSFDKLVENLVEEQNRANKDLDAKKAELDAKKAELEAKKAELEADLLNLKIDK